MPAGFSDSRLVQARNRELAKWPGTSVGHEKTQPKQDQTTQDNPSPNQDRGERFKKPNIPNQGTEEQELFFFFIIEDNMPQNYLVEFTRGKKYMTEPEGSFHRLIIFSQLIGLWKNARLQFTVSQLLLSTSSAPVHSFGGNFCHQSSVSFMLNERHSRKINSCLWASTGIYIMYGAKVHLRNAGSPHWDWFAVSWVVLFNTSAAGFSDPRADRCTRGLGQTPPLLKARSSSKNRKKTHRCSG